MQIECRACHYEYDYTRYGAMCPQCATDNQPFRSAGARRTMGVDEGRIGYFDAKLREERAIAADPMYRKPVLKRLRPYFIVLVFAFAVAFLGSTLMRYAQPEGNSGVANGAKPPILELAGAAYDLSFASVSGRTLSVNAAGDVKDTSVPEGQRMVFVDFVVTVNDRESMGGVFVPPVLVCGETIALPETPQGDWVARYTPLDLQMLEKESWVSGQLFYMIPENVYDCELYYRQDGEKQQLPLLLPEPKK